MRAMPEERHQPAPTRRDLVVVAIPDGKPETLPAGTVVTVTQTLGTSYTVKSERGAKFRVDGKDGDAIGQPQITAGLITPTEQTAPAIQAAARKALGKVFDPEIPVDVINLGLVHEVTIAPLEEGKPEAGFSATVRMGLTSPGCGMGDVLVRDVQDALKRVQGIVSVDAQVVLFPVWNPYTMMSEAAKLKLGML